MKVRILLQILIFTGFFVGFFPIQAHAADISAASCTQASVQTAINQAAEGDRVLVPSGTCTWSTPVSFCKAITLQGAGAGSTVITSSVGTGFGKDAIYVSGCQNKNLIRITGFTFQNQSTDAFGLILFYLSSGTTIRIDNNAFSANGNLGRAISVGGQTFGVIDHNNFTDLGVLIENKQSGEATDGDTSWSQPMSLGSSNAIYLEDNTMNYSVNSVDLDCDDGGRVVYRHNTISGNGIGNHGFDSVPRGCLELDTYNNTIRAGTTAFIGIQYRGGTGINYNNLIQGSFSGGPLAVTNYRSVSTGFVGGYTSRISPNWCNGQNSFDGNTSPGTTNLGWPCRDQLGRGTNQNSYPLYQWNNCKTALGCTPGGPDSITLAVYNDQGGGTNYLPVHIQPNRDYYQAVASFTGTQGIGQGSLGSRPNTCTQGVGYWATDVNTLYTCAGGNSWSAYYTQFQYPHPLVGGAVNKPQPPPTLSATSH